MSSAREDFHSYAIGDGHGLRHDPFAALIAPRPIGWISTSDGQGNHNLSPYSFFNAFNYRPPIIGFASVGWKDSAENIRTTGEFAWNLAPQSLAGAVNASSVDAPAGTDECRLAGLNWRAASKIAAPLVAEAPAAMECRLTQIEQLRGAAGDMVDSWMIFGEVVAVHIHHSLICDDIVDTVRADPLLRGGGNDYFGLGAGSRQSLKRPRWDPRGQI